MSPRRKPTAADAVIAAAELVAAVEMTRLALATGSPTLSTLARRHRRWRAEPVPGGVLVTAWTGTLTLTERIGHHGNW